MSDVGGPYDQGAHTARFEWGPRGAEEVAGAGLVAVVDVLSFTTTLTVAADRGITVYPYRWRDESAVDHARSLDAELAVDRAEAGPGKISLSPGTIRAAEGVRRLVLPSPNGSTVAHLLTERGATVIGVSLRNAAAAARWARGRGGPIAVVAAGERWEDGTLRPAVEDLWGAGAFLHALAPDDPSPEARSAMSAYRDVADDLPRLLHACASGRELIGAGYPEEVTIAAEIDSTDVVPLLGDDGFRPA